MEEAEQALIRVIGSKGLLAVLQAVKPASNKQASMVTITKDGMNIRWEDESKSLQSSIFLNSEVFAEFQVPWVRKTFGLHFHTFTDTLTVFASTSTSDLTIRYPGPNEELTFELVEAISEQQLCTYARINTLDLDLSPEISEYWQEPSSYFLAPGAMLREAIEDLEWAACSGAQTQGSVTVHLKRSPPSITLSASDAAELSIKLPVGDLAGFMCTEAEVYHKYKYKLMRAAFSNLPSAKEAATQMSTKVTVDSSGIMKVMHMVPLFGGGASQGNPLGPSGPNLSQGFSRRGSVHFFLLPQDVVIEYDGEDDV
ncbi:hypothetical protein WJX73_005914 [Symbiochloris irregularis]|uniref:Cell cycle checkpoint protein RAD1 n=1 Tax=Symbiochloris irregularis TaxID=706552 RepID=A0AAW1NLP7_9CHLO